MISPDRQGLIPATHRAVILERLGGPEVLTITQRPTPTPGRGEVLVRMVAAGVAFAQVLMRRGLYAYTPPLPFTPGAEIVGDIVALGDSVDGWTVGERVTAFCSIGGYAELTIVPAESLVRVRDTLDPAAVAALPMNYVTAYELLHRAALVGRGELVLVHGASGGVGTALLELGRIAGLRMVGTASPGKLGLVESLGAEALDYTVADLATRARRRIGSALDVVLDPLGGDHVLESRRALRPGGRLIVYGYSAPGAGTAEALATLRERIATWNASPNDVQAQIYSLGATYRTRPDIVREDLTRMVQLLADGSIDPVIDTPVPLSDVRSAHDRLERGQVRGKLILIPD